MPIDKVGVSDEYEVMEGGDNVELLGKSGDLDHRTPRGRNMECGDQNRRFGGSGATGRFERCDWRFGVTGGSI